MVKEKNFNPVQAQRKADKAKAIKKGKAENQALRDEKLSRRNPARIQKQLDDLKVIVTNGGKLSQHEEQVLAGLEKELSAVKKARATLGDKAPVFANHCNDALGKRQRGDGGQRLRRWDQDSTDEDVPAEVRRIPMPRDTPPPIAKQELDKWYAKRRERRAREEELRQIERGGDASKSIPESSSGTMHDGAGQKAKAREPVAVKKVYEAQPVVRDLVKEAVKAFTPLSVLRKLEKSKGRNGLLEPEEADRLEAQGYLQLKNGISVGGTADELKATVEDTDEDV
ncbi:hypothetical protein Cpir12675_005853 [Ceratocystis pirilliformis]|uniref:Wbp11/ELF5/Saf1 N-terminal domain-containing protein n=1 Tax=Ceratocystis pirilliformis TaxID=259994 RepID=A0ABR3YN09_9PEZI